mmetsp:Transcript_44221/g.68927  ORF Transcript_44221/g.68927 Transcript_44221/m.68927 type:complete len:273 (-) Transcript_44221:421-1239(-)
MPLTILFEFLSELVVVNAFGSRNLLQHVLDSRHHTFKPAKINVSSLVQSIKNLICVLLDAVLDVHLSTVLIRLLSGQGHVVPELVWVRRLNGFPIVIVQERICIRNAEEEPSQALEVLRIRCLLDEHALDERSHRSDTCACGNHDNVGFWLVLGQQHDLATWSCELHHVARLGIAKVVRAHTFLGRILRLQLRTPICCTSHAQRRGFASHVITISGRSNRIQSDLVGLAILRVHARWDDTIRLAFNVRHVATMVNDNVASLASCFGPNDAFH